jgi:hypothetical protein
VPQAAPAIPTQATLDALRDASGPVKSAFDAQAGDAPPSVVVEPDELPAPPAVAATPPGGMAARRDPTPSPGSINVTPFTAPRSDGTPAAASTTSGDASPYPVVANPFNENSREPSNSTSPGSAGFAESPSTAGRADFDESELRAIAPARAFNIVAFLKTTRGMAIAGGAAVLVIILLVVAFSGGGKPDGKTAPVAAKKPDKTVVATTDKAGGGTPDDTNGEAGAHHTGMGIGENGGGEGTGETPTEGEGSGSDATAENAGETTGSAATTGTTTGATKPKTGGAKTPTIGGKQVVLEYDNQARDAQAVHNNAPKSDQTAISKARTSYAAGNQRLFAGDADGAIRYYKQALSYYPAYVAGYRGLGLAYAQQGDKPAALRAFRTYVSSVPGAKDAPLIRKRIANLQVK